MSQYDVAIGLDETTLTQGFSQLHARPDARQKLFKGSRTEPLEGMRYTVDWEVQAAPTFTLAPPPEDLWAQSITAQGTNPKPEDRPIQNAFQLLLPQFSASFTLEGTPPVSGSTKVHVFATATVQGSSLTLTPLSVWFDHSKLSDWDTYILDQFLLPQVLQQAQARLSGLPLPLSFSRSGITLELTPPQVTLGQGRLLLAVSLKDKGRVDTQGVTWPQQPLFVLLSPDVVTRFLGPLASSLEGMQIGPRDGHGPLGSTYTYTATLLKLDNLKLQPGAPTQFSANVRFSFNASVSVLGIIPCSLTSAVKSL